LSTPESFGRGDDLIEEISAPDMEEIVGRGPLQLFWARFREDKVALASFGIVVFVALVAILAPWIVKLVAHPPNAQYPDLLDQNFGTPTGPSWNMLFGVDTVGEDVFSRVLYGARVSLEVALIATFFSVLIGVVLGMIAGLLPRCRGHAGLTLPRRHAGLPGALAGNRDRRGLLAR